MGFRTGFILGLLIGAAWALLIAPSKGEETRQRLGAALVGQDEEGLAARGKGDPLARVNQALRALRQQVQEAWEAAREAAHEAEEEMRKRYQETIHRNRLRRHR